MSSLDTVGFMQKALFSRVSHDVFGAFVSGSSVMVESSHECHLSSCVLAICAVGHCSPVGANNAGALVVLQFGPVILCSLLLHVFILCVHRVCPWTGDQVHVPEGRFNHLGCKETPCVSSISSIS